MRIMKTTRMGMIACVLLICLPGWGDESNQTFLIKDGETRMDIVVAERPERGANLAAKELQENLFKISGVRPAIVTSPGKDAPNHVYVGRSSWTDKLGIDVKDLDQDMYKVVSGKNWLALVGNDDEFTPSEPWAKSRSDRKRIQREWEKRTGRTWLASRLSTFKGYNKNLDIWMSDGMGSFYAVDDFLRSLGVEWYMPGELGEVVPKLTDIPLPIVDKTVKPEVSFRCITFVNFFEPKTSEDVLWYFRLGLGRPAGGFAHSMRLVLGDPNNRVKHPDYYALYNGKRELLSRGGKPCLSSKEFLKEMTDYAKAYFDVYPEARAFPIGPTDGFSHICQCERCKGKDTSERGYSGSLSDYVWSFVNQVAGEIAKSHPGKKIGCSAYTTYLQPPEKVKLHDNVIVKLCRWRQFDTNNPENRQRALAFRQEWKAKLGSKRNLFTHDYYLNNRPGDKRGLPIIFPHAIATDLKSWKGSLKGEYIETWKEKGRLACPALNHLNIYVTARLYWDPDQNVEKLLDDYYRQFYGPAADEARAFYERVEKSFTNYKAEDADFLLKTLDAAAKKVGSDTVYGKRVAQLRGECENKLREILLKKQENKEYAKIEVDESPKSSFTIDGRLDEPAWKASPELALVDCVTGAAPKTSTKFRFAADPSNLYLAVVCQEPDMKGIKTSGSKRDDMSVWLDDAVELILKTPTHSYYQFAFNPNGAMVDVDREKGGLDGITWDSNATAAVTKGSDGWTLELRLPLKDIDGNAPTSKSPWNVNVGRSRPRGKKSLSSIFVPPGKRTFHNLDKMAALAIRGSVRVQN